jgi:hypothetical protein
MKLQYLLLCSSLAACVGDEWVDNPAENIAVSADTGKADAVGQKLCGTANNLPSNVCRTVLDIHEADWHHTRLRSSQGTEIRLDHKPHFLRYCDEWTAGTATYTEERADWTGQPLWFNVSNAAFTGNENVHAVFILKRDSNADCGIYENCGFFQVDLTYAGNHRFTAQWQDGNPIWVKQQVARSDGSKWTTGNAQEIAVVVDGNWQKDPISHSNNFRFELGAGLGF